MVRELLQRALPTAAEPSDLLPQGFGIRRADDDSGFHWLYWGKCPVVRTRDAERLLAALEHHLSVPTAAPDDQLLLKMGAAVSVDGRAFLLPRIGPDVARFDRPLREAGVTIVDRPFVAVDPLRAEVVVPPPAVNLARPARTDLLEELGTMRQEPGVSPGRYAVAGWLIGDTPSTAGRGGAVRYLFSNLTAPTTGRGAQGVSAFVDATRRVVVNVRDVTSVVAAMRGDG